MSAVAPSRENGERRAALELHRLGPGDRDWVLSRLEPEERARAARRLAELDALGVRFEFDDDRIDAAVPAFASTSANAGAGEGEGEGEGDALASAFAPDALARVPDAHARVRVADALAIANILDGAPAWLVDALLDVERWPWRDEVRAALGTRSASVTPAREAVPADAPSRPAMAAALVELVAALLPATTAVVTGGATSGAVDRRPHEGLGASRLWTGVKQWLR